MHYLSSFTYYLFVARIEVLKKGRWSDSSYFNEMHSRAETPTKTLTEKCCNKKAPRAVPFCKKKENFEKMNETVKSFPKSFKFHWGAMGKSISYCVHGRYSFYLRRNFRFSTFLHEWECYIRQQISQEEASYKAER